MQLLSLDEEDTLLFNSQINRTLYTLYRDNMDRFKIMWEQQGTGFWLKYCISLRSVLQKQGYCVQLSALDLSHLEEFFINLVKLLTGTSAVAVHVYVKDVVSISRYHQLLDNLPVDASKVPKQTPQFSRLFGSPYVAGNMTQMFGTLPMHLRAVGGLLRLLERWLVGRAVSTSYKALWHVPDSWQNGRKLMASQFEKFLKRTWDTQLFSLLDVGSRGISWWNTLPEDDKCIKGQDYRGELRRIIGGLSKLTDLPLSNCIGILKDELFCHHIVTSCPRGKFRILHTDSVTLLFISALFRGLYLVDSVTTFHPFSQVIISFSNAAFSHQFWCGGEGLRTQLTNLEEKQISPSPAAILQAAQVNFLLHVVGCHQIRARLAIDLNSKFYDSLYGGITWTSPVTLIRLPWNILLLTNWLEVLLIQIYKFERFFIPLCHFPLHKNIVSLVECVYRKVAEAKFLAKACVIIADGIRKSETQEASRCHDHRKLLHTIIPRLSQMMQFLQTDAYRVLEVILNTGWTKEEREREICPLVKDRIKVDVATWNSVPDINKFYSENYRSINYWITDSECPEVAGGEQFSTEAYEILKNYKLGSTTNVETKDPYDFCKFQKCSKSKLLEFMIRCVDAEQDLILSPILTLDLLQDAGWISSYAANKFRALVCPPCDTPNRNILKGERKKYFNEFLKFGPVYYITAHLLGEKIAGQNGLAVLQQSETFAIMADTGARLSALTQCATRIVKCPPAQYFQNAATELKNYAADTHLSTEEAMLLLGSFEKEANKTADVATDEALTAIEVPLVEDRWEPSVGINWLKYLENKRMQLLQLVSVEQFRITQSYVNNNQMRPVDLFPQHDVLEHRLVEEMAAMQQCLELEGLDYRPAYALCRLLAHRFTWLQQSFIKWKKGEHQLEVSSLPVDTKDLHYWIVKIRIRMMAALIPLQALFRAYISEYQTTHPVNEITTALLYEWTDAACVWCGEDEWKNLGYSLREYCQVLKDMGCTYIEQMLSHCIEVWVVAPFSSDLEAVIEAGSIEHGQLIVTTFTQLFLMCSFFILSQRAGIVCDKICKLEENLVNVTTILRRMEVDESCIQQSWPKARQLLKKELIDVWYLLLEMKRSVPVPMSADDVQFARSFGNTFHVWKPFFLRFIDPEYQCIVRKIAFAVFLSVKDPESDDASSITEQNGHVNETKKSKAANKYVCPVRGPEERCAPILRAEDVHNKRNMASKNKAVEKIVSRNDVREKKALKNMQAKENRDQSKQQLSDESSKQSTQTENEIPRKHKKERCAPILRAEDVHNKHNMASKNKAVEKTVSSNNVREKKALKNMQAKENRDQSKQQLSDESSKQSTQTENEIPRKHKMCTYCKSVESEQRTYKKCSLCKRMNWNHPRFYCSKDCQVKDWKEKHNMEHKCEAVEHRCEEVD